MIKPVKKGLAMYEIEKGIKYPGRGPTKRTLYPLHEMEVGDAFFVPGRADGVANACWYNARKTGRKFSVIKATKDGVEGHRVWRLK